MKSTMLVSLSVVKPPVRLTIVRGLSNKSCKVTVAKSKEDVLTVSENDNLMTPVARSILVNSSNSGLVVSFTNLSTCTAKPSGIPSMGISTMSLVASYSNVR